MSEIVNDATIRVTADASGVEAGLRPAIDAAQRAERAISGIGAGSNASARSQQNLIQAIQRTTAQMEAGSRTGARYWEILARQRGVDPNLLRPYLDQLRAVEQAQRDASTTAEGAGSSIKDAIGGALAGLSIVGLLQQVISAQREFDVLNASLITAVGTTERAAQAFDVLQGFAASTPYSVQQATEAFIQLRNMGLDPSERALRSYGNTAAAMGKDLSQMVEAVADAATGEFERLKEFGIKASQQGSKVSLTFKGVTTTIANNASEIEKYLQKLGEVDFASAMAQRANTLDGSISNLGDAWSATMRTIASSGIGDAAKEGASGLSAALQDLQAMLNAVSEAADKQGASLSVASGIHVALTTVFEALTVVGLNVAYVFKQIGMGIGGAAAQAAALAQGNFSQVKEIRRLMTEDMARDRREVDAQSAAILGAAEKAKKKAAAAASTTGNVDLLAQYRIEREKERESDAAAKKREEQYRREAAALAELSGLSATFAGDWKMLSDLYAKGSISLERLTSAQAELLAKQPAMKAAADEEVAAQKALAEATNEYAKAFDVISGAKDRAVSDLQAQRDENEQIGLGAVALAELNAMRLEDMALRTEQKIMMAEGLDITGAAAQQLREEAAALRERAAAVREGAGKQVAFDTNKQALDDLNQFLDPARAETFGDALREAFGGAGDAISKMTGSLDGFGRRQAQIAEQRAAAEKLRGTKDFDEIAYQRTVLQLSERDTKNRLAGYGAMAGAAAGFFDEQSKGYQALQTVSQVFHAAELAMTLAELVPKGISAVLSQGSGDPYTAFGRMAAMAAIVGGLGVAIGGVSGGGVPLSESRQKSQGTGTVLGSDAKSESIARALESIEGVSVQGLAISNGMLSSLRNIEAGIGQFASLLVRTTGVTGKFGDDLANRGSADAFGRSNMGLLATGGIFGLALDKITGGWVGKITGSVLNKIFGGKTTVEDTGFTAGKTDFASIAAGGLNAMQFADIKKDGGWFSKDKTSVQTQSLGEEGNRQIASVLMSLYDTVLEAGTMIGLGTDGFEAQLNSFVVDIGKISLKGLSDDEIEKELSAVFSKVGDDLAAFGVDGLGQFQKVGEGYLETLTRVATNYQAVTVVTDSMGMTFNAVGLASVGARERLIGLVGGLDEFTSSADQFLADFYTDKERADSLRARITPTLDQYGIQSGAEDSLKQFRGVVTGLDLTTEAGARAYAALMQIAPAFKQIADVDADVLEKAADLANSKRELEIQIMEMLGDKSGALAANRALELREMDASLRPLQERVYALEDEATAVQASNARRSLEAQIMGLAGDKAGELAITRALELAGMDAALRPLKERIFGLQDEATALQSSNARRGLEAQIMGLSGDKAGELAITRAQELAGMDGALRPLKERIFVLQDEAAALQASNSLLGIQAQIYELTGDKAGAAAVKVLQQANALAALEPALRGATATLWGLQAAAQAAQLISADAGKLESGIDSAYATLRRVVDAQKQAMQDEITVRTKAVEKVKSLSDALRGSLDSMSVSGREAEDRGVAQAQIQAALAIITAGGSLPNVDDLKSALSVLGQDSSGQFATQQDYLRDFYATRIGIESLADITDSALSVDERALAAAEGQLDQLDSMLQYEQEQIDVLKGISTTGLSSQQALEALRGLMAAGLNNPVVAASSAINKAYQDNLGRAPDAAGFEWWKNAAANGASVSEIVGGIAGSTEAELKKLYKSLLGRTPDAAGLAFWMQAYGPTMDDAERADWMRNTQATDEYKLRGFAVGTNRVPFDMPALIHQDERIIPAADNRELMRRLASPSEGSTALVEEIRLLRQQVERLEASSGRTADATEGAASNTKQLADQFDNVTEGGNAMRGDVINIVRVKETA